MPKTKLSITQDEVDEFARICARMKIDENRRKELRAKFIEARDLKIKIPDKGPHLIKFTDKERLNVPWKDECFILARVLFDSFEAAEEHIKMVEADADFTPVVEVSPGINPNWVAKAEVLTMPTRKVKRR